MYEIRVHPWLILLRTLAGLVYPERAVQLLAIRSAVLRSAVLRNAVIQIAVIHDAVLIVVPISVLILALNAVLIVASIQALIPARDALSAEFHAAVPSPAQVVRCVARVCWQERSRSFPVVAHVFPIHPHGRGVDEAQAVLQRHLVEFLRWSQELLLALLLAPLWLVDSLRALSARVRERLLTF